MTGRVGLVFICVSVLTSPAAAFAQYAIDRDHDGVRDSADVFPCDPTASAAAYVPYRGGWSMVLFEDEWPYRSDLDFNDAAIAMNVATKGHGGHTSAIRMTLNALALGGIFSNGLGLALGTPATNVVSVTRWVGNGPAEALAPSTVDRTLAVELSSNLRELFGGYTAQINSVPGMPRMVGQPLVVEIKFASPITTYALDLFVFRSDDTDHEIHFPSECGTARMDKALFGTGIDASNPPGRCYVDGHNLPFAIYIPRIAKYPAEGREIAALFPRIIPWAGSGGATHTDFYSQGVNPRFEYPTPIAPVFPNGQASYPVDRSCLR